MLAGIKKENLLLRRFAKHNFSGIIQRNVELYYPGTRDWLLKKLRLTIGLQQKTDRNCCLLLLCQGMARACSQRKFAKSSEKGRIWLHAIFSVSMIRFYEILG